MDKKRKNDVTLPDRCYDCVHSFCVDDGGVCRLSMREFKDGNTVPDWCELPNLRHIGGEVK